MKLSEYGRKNGLSGIAPDQRERDARDLVIHEKIESLRGLEGRAYDRALSDVLRSLLPFFDRWSYLICRTNGDHQYDQRQDIISVASENAVKMFRPEGMENRHPSNWMPYLHRMMQNRSSTYYGSSEQAFVSGATMLRRRKGLISKYTAELRGEFGREPTMLEIIEHGNTHLRSTRSNPERQSVLLSEEDFDDLPGSVSFDHLSNVVYEESDQTLIHQVEGKAIVTAIISACGELTADHSKVASLWVGDLYSTDPIVRGSEEIAKMLNMPLGIVESILSDVRTAAVTISTQKFGIDFPAA